MGGERFLCDVLILSTVRHVDVYIMVLGATRYPVTYINLINVVCVL